jgi:hypothetical protein
MLLTSSERQAVREGRLSKSDARYLIRRRLMTTALGAVLGYGGLWLLSRLL